MKLTEIKDSAVFWLSCIIAFNMPFSKQVVGIATGLLFLLSVWNFKYRDLDQNQKRFLWILISFYMIHAISLIYTENIRTGLLHLDMKLSLVAFPVAFALNSKLDKRKVEIILGWFIAAMLIACLISLGYAFYRYLYDIHVYKQNIFFFYYNDLIDPFKLDPAYYSLYVGFATLLLIVFLIDNASKIKRRYIIMLGIAVAFLSGFNILISARMPLFVYLVILVFLLSSRVKIKSWVGYAAIAIFLGALALFIAQNKYTLNRISQVNTLSYDIKNPDFKAWNGITTRLAIWACGMEIITDNVLLGVGRGDSEDELFKVYRQKNFHYALNEEYNLHNQYLQTLMGVGLVGLAILMISLALSVQTAFQRRDWYYIVFICLVLLCFTTESMLARLKGVMFFSFFNALLFFYCQKQKE